MYEDRRAGPFSKGKVEGGVSIQPCRFEAQERYKHKHSKLKYDKNCKFFNYHNFSIDCFFNGESNKVTN